MYSPKLNGRRYLTRAGHELLAAKVPQLSHELVERLTWQEHLPADLEARANREIAAICLRIRELRPRKPEFRGREGRIPWRLPEPGRPELANAAEDEVDLLDSLLPRAG